MTSDPKVRPALGRQGTIDALVDSAIALFGESGPDAVSLREVAAHAGVNYGLIHQYVGSKDDLVRLTLARLSDRSSERLRSEARDASIARLLSGTTASPSLRLLTWALLQRREGPELLTHSPAIDALTDSIIESDATADPNDARQRAVAAMATVLGWQLFGTYLRSASGLGESSAHEVALVLEAMLDRLLGASPGGATTDE